MNNKNILISLVVLVAFGGLVYWFMNQNGSTANNSNYSPTTQPTPTDKNTTSNSNTLNATLNTSVSTTKTSNTYKISIQNYAFSNPNLTVKKGDTVVWTNEDSAPHTVTADTGGPVSGTLNKGQSYSYTFTGTGIYSYHCSIHPMMKGSVTVN